MRQKSDLLALNRAEFPIARAVTRPLKPKGTKNCYFGRIVSFNRVAA